MPRPMQIGDVSKSANDSRERFHLRYRSEIGYNTPFRLSESTVMSVTTVQSTTYGRDASIAKFSVARYQRMIETGILTSEDKVELLENNIVLTLPRNPSHDGTIQLVS